jgi:predicted secreted hydrolase
MVGVVLVIAMGAIGALWRSASQSERRQEPDESPFSILGELEANEFLRVQDPWNYQFPADHGAHSQFRTEWWYLTGSVNDDRGHRLGLQLVLMRLGLTAKPQRRSSHWAATEIYAGLFSISDPVDGRLRSYQRSSRAALGLAGTETQPMQVWLENWRLAQSPSGKYALDRTARIASDDLNLDLKLLNRKPLVDANAIREQRPAVPAPFYFYVQPRLRAEGTLRLDKQQTALDGTLSLEHAWGELPLPGGPIAFDRFTLHLDEGRELFCVRTHRVDGSGTPSTTGVLIGKDNRPRLLSRDDIELIPTGYWLSTRTGARYPVRWTLRVPPHGIELALMPHWQNQEGNGWAPYWAGPVRLRGTSPTTAAAGDGFMQLNGYHDS